MKKFTLLALFITVLSFNSFAQQAAQIKAAAQIMATATLNGDYKALAKYTHPKVVKMMGGQDKMITVVKQGLEQMKTQGYKIESVKVGNPGKVITTPSGLYSALSQSTVLNVNGKKLSNTSTLLANSADKGKTWSFVDAGGMTDAQLKQIFPDVVGKLEIAKRTAPVLLN